MPFLIFYLVLWALSLLKLVVRYQCFLQHKYVSRLGNHPVKLGLKRHRLAIAREACASLQLRWVRRGEEIFEAPHYLNIFLIFLGGLFGLVFLNSNQKPYISTHSPSSLFSRSQTLATHCDRKKKGLITIKYTNFNSFCNLDINFKTLQLQHNFAFFCKLDIPNFFHQMIK